MNLDFNDSKRENAHKVGESVTASKDRPKLKLH